MTGSDVGDVVASMGDAEDVDDSEVAVDGSEVAVDARDAALDGIDEGSVTVAFSISLGAKV